MAVFSVWQYAGYHLLTTVNLPHNMAAINSEITDVYCLYNYQVWFIPLVDEREVCR